MGCEHASLCKWWDTKPTKCSTCRHNDNLKDQFINKITGCTSVHCWNSDKFTSNKPQKD